MALLELADQGGYRTFDEAQCREAGRSLATQYRGNDPFPHIVIDDFIDVGLLRQILAEFPDAQGKTAFARNQERLKFQFKPGECRGAVSRMLFAELNSQAFLGFLAEMTGIKGLIADAYFAGAGLHETKAGGHLGIHADFPKHDVMKVDRRLNLLIYLNEDWQASYGGALELWDRQMHGCRQSVLPVLGRAVVFSTERDTFHGHPDPLTCPPDRSRRSIATYYYTAPVAELSTLDRTTDFRPRPKSMDKRDWQVWLHHMKVEWLPPALQRGRGA